MFIKYLEPIFKPWRAMRNKIMRVKTTRGNIKAETSRVKRFGQQAKQQKAKVSGQVQKAQGQAQKAQGQAQKTQGHAQQMRGQMPGQMPSGAMPQAQMPPGAMPPGQMPQQPHFHAMPPGAHAMQHGHPPGAPPPGMLNPNPPIRIKGFFRRRKICTQCNAELDKTWDSCPYCAQAAAAQQAPPTSNKTQAFMLNQAVGGITSVQLLGWLVPLKGPLRGELYTLAPNSVIGTDPTCTVVLQDSYMSSRHAEVVAQGGVWILRDLGSTNGTKVNDKPTSQHELVDNDFIMFGQSLVKFKCL